MLVTSKIAPDSKTAFYRDLEQHLTALLSGETDRVANAANTSALLFQDLPDVNWVGFYFLHNINELILGPFQGKPACVRIAMGQGVCGTAASRRRSVLVDDVHSFPGHIVCDLASRSELVVPLVRGDLVVGVLDLDSPVLSRFDSADQAGIERLAEIYLKASFAK